MKPNILLLLGMCAGLSLMTGVLQCGSSTTSAFTGSVQPVETPVKWQKALRVVSSNLIYELAHQQNIVRHHEFWVSTNALGTDGIGTITRPFDGSTRVKFDSVMDAFPTNCTIHLMAGTYPSWGDQGYVVKSGQKIIGAGRNATILQIAADAPPGDTLSVMRSTCQACDGDPAGSPVYLNSGIEVSDLTLDANYQTGTTNGRGGITLYATKSAIRRVNLINAAHVDSNRLSSESWGFLINSYTNSAGGCIIEDCEISQYRDGALSGFSLVAQTPDRCIGGIIRNNRAYLTGTINPAVCALSGASMKNVLFEGNYIEGGAEAFHADTFGMTNVLFRHNFFKGVTVGFMLQATARNNLMFFKNTILLNPAANSVAFYTFNGTYTNMSILGNKVALSGASQEKYYRFLILGNISGLEIAGNQVHSDISGANVITSCTGIHFHANYDENGHLLSGLNLPAVSPSK